MATILLFGATGHAGRAIAQALITRGHKVTAVVRNEQIAKSKLWGVEKLITADPTKPETIKGICQSFGVVISALGKSVSINDWSRPSFEEVDYQGNMNILEEAVSAGVEQFMYISAFGAENMRHLTYFRVHDDFSNQLKRSGLKYAIVQPPAIMSSFLDLAKMAQKGWLFTIGNGNCRTNPISEYDLAQVCAGLIGSEAVVVAAGGKQVYTRHEINVTIQQCVAPNQKVRKVPLWMLKSALPVWKLFNRNMYDKLAFFAEVINHDLLAPPIGNISLQAYFTPDRISS